MKRKKPPTLRSEIASLRRAMLRTIKAHVEMQRQIQLLRLDVQGMRYTDLPKLMTSTVRWL